MVMAANGKRRPKGDGAVYETADGRVRGYVEIESEDGTRKRKYFSGATPREVAGKIRRARSQVERGLPIPDARITVAQLGEKWLEHGLRHDLASNTRAEKAAHVKFISARIGGVRAMALTPSKCAAMVNEMLAEGYSGSYAGRMRSVLSQILDFGEAEGIVARNVAKLSPSVSFAARERERLNGEEAILFLKAAEDHRLGVAAVVMMTLGLRPGEAMGIRWPDVDLEARVVHLRQALLNRPDPTSGKRVLSLGEPKRSKNPVRSIRLPAVTVRALQRHHVAQGKARMKAGPHWVNEADLVFTTQIGTPVDPANLRRAVREITETAGLKKSVVPYDFRRAVASLLSDADVSGERIADVLGNDPKTALSVYRRRLGPVVEDAVGPMDDLFGTA
jgi:integrase